MPAHRWVRVPLVSGAVLTMKRSSPVIGLPETFCRVIDVVLAGASIVTTATALVR
jgi:hypothetical protein